jgi:UDP-N-acetylmuramoyl-L-alanyl-D-glutamate--2,6-diaminopimelate ligase
VAIKGTFCDGSSFIKQAIERGARLIIRQPPVQEREVANAQIPSILVKDSRKVLAELAAVFYGRPSHDLKIVGITGTNGKTSVSYLIEALLKKAGIEVAVVGTINQRFKDKVICCPNTTPSAVDIQYLFSQARASGVECVVMEVSSHGLEQKRVEAVKFHSAVFTNLSAEHLDYHQNMKNYFQSKARLFETLTPSAIAVVNRDSPYAQKLIDLTSARVLTYGLKSKADIVAWDMDYNIRGMRLIVHTPRGQMRLRSRLFGEHNAYNILAALSAALSLTDNLSLQQMCSAIEEFRFVPGRLERIECGQDFFVFVDYAHSPDALKNVLACLRKISRRRLIVVFGCGGNRDREKRAQMGRVACELADYALITDDNPRDESAQQIISDIVRGINKDNYKIIQPRQAAIRYALSRARKEDIVLIAGKGHENYQIIKNQIIPFDDREIVRTCLG